MVLDTNSFPIMTGPGTQTAAPEIEHVISNGFVVEDEDNDENVDGAQAGKYGHAHEVGVVCFSVDALQFIVGHFPSSIARSTSSTPTISITFR